MPTPYSLFNYLLTVRQVLAGYSGDMEFMQQLTNQQAWALGKLEGSADLLATLLPKFPPSDPLPGQIIPNREDK